MTQGNRLTFYQIYRLLPKSNCKACGCSSCLAFASALIVREKKVVDCPELQTELFRSSLELLEKYFSPNDLVESNGMIIHKERCIGCGDCAAVCNYALSIMGTAGDLKKIEIDKPVLQIIDGVVNVLNVESCKRCAKDNSELCSVCASKCVFDALELLTPRDN